MSSVSAQGIEHIADESVQRISQNDSGEARNILDGVVYVPPLRYGDRDPVPPLPSGNLMPDGVPAAVRHSPQPLIRFLMPAMMIVMMLMMVGLSVFASSSSGGGIGSALRTMNPMMLMFPLMMGMSMVTMFLPQPGQDSDEARRIFLRHLDQLRKTALDHARQQKDHELHKHPDPASLWSRVSSRRLWERQADDPDAFLVRLGLGVRALCTPIKLGDTAAPEDLDPVCAVSVRRAVRMLGSVEGLPIVLSLTSFRVVSFIGPYAHECVRAVIAAMVFAHGPEALSIRVVGRNPEWLKWLPHSVDNEEAPCRLLLIDANQTPSDLKKCAEALVAMDYSLLITVNGTAAEIVAGFFEGEEYIFGEEREDIVLFSVDMQRRLSVVTPDGLEYIGIADALSDQALILLARSLHRYARPPSYSSSDSGALFPMLGFSSSKEIRPEDLWPARSLGDAQRLRVPIGRETSGSPAFLDIKESAQGGFGPHGLCIGATGSGKSELLRTLVVSLALTHSPDELNMVLVDFKGGATFLGLESLPHTSAVITNLAGESTLVDRMHDVISGELNRRQEILRAAGNLPNVDAYAEQRLRDPQLEPLPALLIVVDEFSELLDQHPEFSDLFVAVGRLGRSLHIHLLLASQRLEEGKMRGLDSHLSYRIGLKTFSSAESRAVLGCPDAYHLPNEPGRGLMKRDADAIIEFQTSYVSGVWENEHDTSEGGEYGGIADEVSDAYGSPSGSEETSGVVRIFECSTQRVQTKDRVAITSLKRKNQQDSSLKKPRTLLDKVVELTTHAAASRGSAARQIWLPPLPQRIGIAELARDVGKLCAVIGLIDRPYVQKQDPCVVNFSGAGGHLALCGGPQTGKSTALYTLMVSLSVTHSTEDIRFYVLDLGGGLLSSAQRMPHIAGIADRKDPERVRRVVAEVVSFIDRPATRHTFLIVDGWNVLSNEFDDIESSLVRIASEGLAAGVHLVLTTQRWNGVRPAIRDLITQRIELKLVEPLDSLIDRKAQEKLVSAPGRALTPEGEQLLLAFSAEEDAAYVADKAEMLGYAPVPSLRVLPGIVHYDDVYREVPQGALCLGRGGADLTPIAWDTQLSSHFLCFGGQGSGKSSLIMAVMRGLYERGREHVRVVLVDPRRSHLDMYPNTLLAAYCSTTSSISEAMSALAHTLRERLPGSDISAAQLKARDWWEGPELYLIIDDAELLPAGVLQPLVELLPHARDIGFHMVYVRKAGGAGRALYDPVLGELRDQTPAFLLLDADPDEGKLLGLKAVAQPPGRGVLQVRGNRLGVVQIVYPKTLPRYESIEQEEQ